MCVCVHVCIYLYVHMYIKRDRERHVELYLNAFCAEDSIKKGGDGAVKDDADDVDCAEEHVDESMAM